MKTDYYTKVSLKDQATIIRKHFGITISVARPPKLTEGEHLFVIPKWQKIGTTYNDAVKKVLDKIKDTKPFYNYRGGKLGPEYIRPLQRDVPEIVAAQFGMQHKGQSVNDVRKSIVSGEVLFGAYEVGIMLLTHPDRLTKYENLLIDCAGDEASPDADGDFSSAPVLCFYDKLEFNTVALDIPLGNFGTVSGFVSQSNLETRTLETSEILSLESRIKNLEDFKAKVEKVLKV